LAEGILTEKTWHASFAMTRARSPLHLVGGIHPAREIMIDSAGIGQGRRHGQQ